MSDVVASSPRPLDSDSSRPEFFPNTFSGSLNTSGMLHLRTVIPPTSVTNSPREESTTVSVDRIVAVKCTWTWEPGCAAGAPAEASRSMYFFKPGARVVIVTLARAGNCALSFDANFGILKTWGIPKLASFGDPQRGRTWSAMSNKRCPHGKQKGDCAACTPCPHGVVARLCTECSGCPHGRQKNLCLDCVPCSHGKVKHNCAVCNPCPHDRLKSKCKECNGCVHGKLRFEYSKCNPCPHGRLKGHCGECNPCPHGKLKSRARSATVALTEG
jgi:hypothetical protein